MDLATIKERFRSIDLDNYPNLAGLDRSQIYSGKMGPGGLFLASKLCEQIQGTDFEKMRIMDLGCGKGTTSIFLGRNFDSTVYAIDLWIQATEIFQAVKKANLEDRVLPFNLDITGPLPFANDYFDVIFCMDAIHYFGANPGFLDHLCKYLKSGGVFVIGSPCFDREFDTPPPEVYKAFWQDEFSKYHSPGFWQKLFQDSAIFKEVFACEAPDGELYWQDSLLHDIEIGNHKDGRIEADADEIVFGREHPEYPYLTHFILKAIKR